MLAVEHATTSEHGTANDEAEAFVNQLGQIFPKEKIRRSIFGPVVGAHIGPHGIGVAVVEEI